MKRNLLALAVAAVSVMPLVAQAAPTVYGRLNLSTDYTTDKTSGVSGQNTNWEVNSNASRVGVKGNEKLDDDFTAVYKAEWSVTGDTAGAADLSGRERYVGLKHGNLGTIRLGAIDSPLKTSEDEVDVFNDLRHLDMQNILTGQNRLNNSINYVSPKILDVFGANITFQPGESGKLAGGGSKNHLADAYSAAFSYEDDSLYLSAGFDKKVTDTNTKDDLVNNGLASAGITLAGPRNSLRLVGRYKMNDLTFAGLFQKSSLDKNSVAPTAKGDENAILLSASYKVDKFTYKGEIGQNDLKGDIGAGTVAPKDKISFIGVGLDYNFTQNTKVFGNLASNKYTAKDNTGTSTTNKMMQLGGGIEIRF